MLTGAIYYVCASTTGRRAEDCDVSAHCSGGRSALPNGREPHCTRRTCKDMWWYISVATELELASPIQPSTTLAKASKVQGVEEVLPSSFARLAHRLVAANQLGERVSGLRYDLTTALEG